MKADILILDDDENIRNLITYSLGKNDYNLVECGSGESAIEYLKRYKPDIAVIDILLPGINGYEVVAFIKSAYGKMGPYIIFLSQKNSEEEIFYGLDRFADDYISKPFSPKILKGKINAVLRRNETTSKKKNRGGIEIGGIKIDTDYRKVTVAGELIHLTKSEFDILYFLAKSPERIFSREQIAGCISTGTDPLSTTAIDNHIYNIRKKLKSGSRNIETISGLGYKMKIS